MAEIHEVLWEFSNYLPSTGFIRRNISIKQMKIAGWAIKKFLIRKAVERKYFKFLVQLNLNILI